MIESQSNIAHELAAIAGYSNVLTDTPMSDYTTFKVGGCADYLVFPENTNALTSIIQYCLDNNRPWFLLGKGSNLVVSDKGMRCVVIATNKLNSYSFVGNTVTADCGVDLIKLSKASASTSLSGLEFACGIPGSVGGAVYMNAGAYEGDISQVLLSSQALSIEQNGNGQLQAVPIVISSQEHRFSYRHSIFQDRQLIHISSTFQLIKRDKNQILSKIDKLTTARESKQPLELPSAGSVFRRPAGYFVGKLIEECGLRGYRLGGAAVSEKHCGFIVNLGNATASDIKALISYVQDTVFNRFGVELQTEIRFVGEE